MSLFYLIFAFGIALCIAANFHGRKLRKRDPVAFERLRRKTYPPASFLLAVIFSWQGITAEREIPALIVLGSAAFFATSFVQCLKSSKLEENRFGMLQLMMFVTCYAILLGCRYAIS